MLVFFLFQVLLFNPFIQPEEGPSTRAETSYPIAGFWVAGDERELWKILFMFIFRVIQLLAIGTVILQIFGVVSFSVFSVVNGFTEIKRDT